MISVLENTPEKAQNGLDKLLTENIAKGIC